MNFSHYLSLVYNERGFKFETPKTVFVITDNPIKKISDFKVIELNVSKTLVPTDFRDNKYVYEIKLSKPYKEGDEFNDDFDSQIVSFKKVENEFKDDVKIKEIKIPLKILKKIEDFIVYGDHVVLNDLLKDKNSLEFIENNLKMKVYNKPIYRGMYWSLDDEDNWNFAKKLKNNTNTLLKFSNPSSWSTNYLIAQKFALDADSDDTLESSILSTKRMNKKEHIFGIFSYIPKVSEVFIDTRLIKNIKELRNYMHLENEIILKPGNFNSLCIETNNSKLKFE